MSYISTSYPPSSSPTAPRKDPASSPSTHTSHRYPSDSLSHLHVDLGAARNPPADLDHLSRPIPPPPPSAESPRSAQSFPPRPSSVHRRQSSYLRKLELNAELERKQFGLTDVCVSTSPGPGPDCPDSTDEITIDLSLTPTPRAATMSHATTHHQSGGSLAAPQLPIARTPTPAMNVPSSRTRNPVPPSPLSKVSSPSDEPTAFPEPSPTTQLSPPALHHAQTSPCFIHSHLDRHGSLQDWLAHKTNTSSDQNGNGPSKPKQRAPEPKQFTANRHSHSPHHAPHHRHHTSATPSGPSSQPATPRREPSGSGYESDKSSANGHQSLSGSAVLDGDFLEDEEEGGSLTKQLAETAQGVREMSKELGRTRVRSRIQHVLVVTKARDNRLIQLTRELALYLMQKRPVSSPDGRNSDRGMVVYVDAQLRHSKRFDAAGIQRDYPDLFQPIHRRRSSSSASLTAISAFPSTSSMSDFSRRPRDEGQLRYWTSEMCSNSPHLFDFVVTLGGDGTVLFTSWLFQKIVPPVLPFALGSLGFLTNFDFAQYKRTMDKVVDDGIRVNLRMRFTCTVYRAIAPEEAARAAQQGGRKRKAIKKPGGEILINQVDRSGWESLEGPSSGGVQPCQPCQEKEDKEIMCYTTRPVEQFEVLNDLVVDRGPSPYVSLLELFGDEHHLTTVQADGLTVSTPTGSTAYSLSAGGSLVHPQIPALLITPICPHTLSFRPMLLPDSMELRICVPYNSRSTAWASFDGRGRVELKQGDHIKVTASKYPFPTVCADKASTDWFSSISRTLRWNEREKQKSFVVVEEENEPVDKRRAKKKVQTKPDYAEIKKNGPDAIKEMKEFHEDEDSEEEEEYDIDDKSGGDVTPLSPKEHEPPINPHKLSDMLSGHKSGVDTPDRYVTHCSAPPPLSQRHLIDALAAAEIKEKENEMGQRDHIRAGASEMRTDGTGHLIPPGRSHLPSPEGRGGEAQRTPKASKKRLSGELKSKAFAFFGQDDSASDVSDDLSE